MRAALYQNIGFSRAVAELVHRLAEFLRHVQPEVSNRCPSRQFFVAMSGADSASDGNHWQRVSGVNVRIGHARAIDEQGMIEQRSVSIRRGAQFLKEFSIH